MILVNSCDNNVLVDPNVNTKWEDKKDQAKRNHTIKSVAESALCTLAVVGGIAALVCFVASVGLLSGGSLPIALIILGVSAGCGLVCGASLIGIYNVQKDLTPYHSKVVAQRMVQNLKTKTLAQVATKLHPWNYDPAYSNVHTHNLAKYGFISKKAARTIRELVKQHQTINADLQKFVNAGLDEATRKQYADRLNDLEAHWNNFRANVIVPNLPNPLNLAAPAA